MKRAPSSSDKPHVTGWSRARQSRGLGRSMRRRNCRGPPTDAGSLNAAGRTNGYVTARDQGGCGEPPGQWCAADTSRPHGGRARSKLQWTASARSVPELTAGGAGATPSTCAREGAVHGRTLTPTARTSRDVGPAEAARAGPAPAELSWGDSGHGRPANGGVTGSLATGASEQPVDHECVFQRTCRRSSSARAREHSAIEESLQR